MGPRKSRFEITLLAWPVVTTFSANRASAQGRPCTTKKNGSTSGCGVGGRRTAIGRRCRTTRCLRECAARWNWCLKRATALTIESTMRHGYAGRCLPPGVQLLLRSGLVRRGHRLQPGDRLPVHRLTPIRASCDPPIGCRRRIMLICSRATAWGHLLAASAPRCRWLAPGHPPRPHRCPPSDRDQSNTGRATCKGAA